MSDIQATYHYLVWFIDDNQFRYPLARNPTPEELQKLWKTFAIRAKWEPVTR